MALSWIKRVMRPLSVDDLVAAGEYGKAIDLMREEFSQRYPSTTERQHYAEVLVRAGRAAEAVPVLLGIADEQERYGFPDKALEALRCAAAIDPEQAEVKERLESMGSVPPEATADEPPSPAEEESSPAGAADSWGSMLDGASVAQAAPQESEPVAGCEPGGVAAERAADAVDPAPPGDNLELVVVDPEDTEITATSTSEETGTPGPEESEPVAADADDGETTAPSIVVEPSVLGAEESKPTAAGADEGEITATSIRVEPNVPGEDQLGPGADEGEITATSIRVEPSVLAPEEADPDAEDREHTKPSIVVEPGLLEADDLEPLAADEEDPGLTAPGPEPEPDLLLPEEDLEPEEVEELTADGFLPESGPEAGKLGPIVRNEALEAALTADAQALLSDGPTKDEPGPLDDDSHLHELLSVDARALLSGGPTSDEPGAVDDDGYLDELLATDAQALLSDGPTPDGSARSAVEARPDEQSAADAPALPARAMGEHRSGPRPADGNLDQLLAADVRALFREGSTSHEPEPSAAKSTPEGELAADARGLLAGGPANDPSERPGGNGQPEEALAADARSLLSGGHPDETHLFLSEDDLLGALTGGDELDPLVLSLAQSRASDRPTLGSLLLADLPRDELRGASEGLHRRTYSPGDTVIREGEPGHSLFLIASGSVRILVMGGHGQPFEIRRIDAGGFFGEVAALSGKPRSATVVAATPCEMLEIDRRALDTLIALRPAARPVLDDAWARRALSPEETAVRSLPPEAADPRRAAEALRAQFAGAEWSPRVRLHLSGMMLEAGRAGDALATLSGVAEDLAQRGHAKEAIAILKKAGRFRHRSSGEVTEDAAFRERVESLLGETTELAARAAPSVEEVAEGTGEEQGDQLAG